MHCGDNATVPFCRVAVVEGVQDKIEVNPHEEAANGSKQ